MISAARHPLPATCHMLHAHATHQAVLNKSLAYSGGVECSTGSFWPMKNSDFVEALAYGRL